MNTGIIALIGITYSLSVLLYCFKSRRLTTHAFIQIAILLGLYGQVLRLWLLGEPIDKLEIPMTGVLIAHLFLELAWVMSYFGMRKGSPSRKYKEDCFQNRPLRAMTVILALTLIALTGWFTLFAQFGGTVNFLMSGMIDQRVALFRGRGYLLILYSFLLLSNAMFFAFIVFERHRIRKRWFLYTGFALHTILLWFTCIPLGQRGGIISPMIFWILIGTVRKRRFNRKIVVVVAVSIIFLINLLGVLRNDKVFTMSNVGSFSDVLSRGYGFAERLNSYVQVYEGTPDYLDYQWGKTYLTVFTQFVPRKLWPDKWDCAGVLITKNIIADAEYSRRSNMQPTMFGEAFLNFSYFGFLLVPIIIGWFIGYIDRRRKKTSNMWDAVIFSNWTFVCFFIVNGDFVNSMFGGIIFWLVLLVAKHFCSFRWLRQPPTPPILLCEKNRGIPWRRGALSFFKRTTKRVSCSEYIRHVVA